MPVSTFTQPDFTSQTGEEYKTNLDDAANVFKRISSIFAPHAQASEDMTIRIDAGHIFRGGSLTEVAAQNTSTITAPTVNPRIDRVVVDVSTGTASVVAGSEAASPSAPAIPSGKIPVAQIALTVGQTEIANADITDERVLSSSGVSVSDIYDLSSYSTAGNLQSSDRFLIWDNGSSANNTITWATVLTEIVSDLTGLTISNIAASAIVTEAEGIASNDNDTTLPTSASVKAYVDNNATAPQQTAQFWIKMNGKGTISIYDEYNISSITDNATGRYELNFSSDLADANCAVVASVCDGTPRLAGCTGQTVSSVEIHVQGSAFSYVDYDEISVIGFGGV